MKYPIEHLYPDPPRDVARAIRLVLFGAVLGFFVARYVGL